MYFQLVVTNTEKVSSELWIASVDDLTLQYFKNIKLLFFFLNDEKKNQYLLLQNLGIITELHEGFCN